MAKSEYSKLLQDGRWLILRMEVLKRDDFTCTRCGAMASKGATLHIHHVKYFPGHKPWEYDPKFLETVCEPCHRVKHQLIKPTEPMSKELSDAMYENSRSFLTATQTHIDILMDTLRRGVPAEMEDEILKNILYLQQKRREYKDGL